MYGNVEINTENLAPTATRARTLISQLPIEYAVHYTTTARPTQALIIIEKFQHLLYPSSLVNKKDNNIYPFTLRDCRNFSTKILAYSHRELDVPLLCNGLHTQPADPGSSPGHAGCQFFCIYFNFYRTYVYLGKR